MQTPAPFPLCPSCVASFRVLRYDVNAICHTVLIPFNSLVWSDELPPDAERKFLHHQECLHALVRLFSARKQVWWDCGDLAADRALLAEARQLLPDWPGFQRLRLSEADRRALESCESETAEMIQNLRQDAAIFAVTEHRGGVVSMTVYPRTT